eukprot:273220-Amphidinium_carterae.3
MGLYCCYGWHGMYGLLSGQALTSQAAKHAFTAQGHINMKCGAHPMSPVLVLTACVPNPNWA